VYVGGKGGLRLRKPSEITSQVELKEEKKENGANLSLSIGSVVGKNSFCEVKIRNGCVIKGLFDTGSSRCIMSESFWLDLRDRFRIDLALGPRVPTLTGATGLNLVVLGNVKVEFSIADMNFKEEVYVVRGLPRQLVFGYDFIAKRKVVVDGSADSVYFRTESSTFSPGENSRNLTLYLVCDVVLEPRSEHVIEVSFGPYERRLGFTQ
jgi:hypothetical protein